MEVGNVFVLTETLKTLCCDYPIQSGCTIEVWQNWSPKRKIVRVILNPDGSKSSSGLHKVKISSLRRCTQKNDEHSVFDK